MKTEACLDSRAFEPPTTHTNCQFSGAAEETAAGAGSPTTANWTMAGLAAWALRFTITAALVAGCASAPSIQTQTTPGADCSGYRTFAVKPVSTPGPAAVSTSALRWTQPARHMVAQRLRASGLTEVDEAQADITVNLQAGVVPRVKVTYWGCLPEPVSRAALGWYAGGNAPRGETIRWYSQQTLSVGIVDRRTRQLAWSGQFTSEGPPDMTGEQLQKGLQELFDQFPIGPRLASLAPLE